MQITLKISKEQQLLMSALIVDGLIKTYKWLECLNPETDKVDWLYVSKRVDCLRDPMEQFVI